MCPEDVLKAHGGRELGEGPGSEQTAAGLEKSPGEDGPHGSRRYVYEKMLLL